VANASNLTDREDATHSMGGAIPCRIGISSQWLYRLIHDGE
jgi:hypothetical protein